MNKPTSHPAPREVTSSHCTCRTGRSLTSIWAQDLPRMINLSLPRGKDGCSQLFMYLLLLDEIFSRKLQPGLVLAEQNRVCFTSAESHIIFKFQSLWFNLGAGVASPAMRLIHLTLFMLLSLFMAYEPSSSALQVSYCYADCPRLHYTLD